MNRKWSKKLEKLKKKAESAINSEEVEQWIEKTLLEEGDCYRFFKAEGPTEIGLCMGIQAPHPDAPEGCYSSLHHEGRSGHSRCHPFPIRTG